MMEKLAAAQSAVMGIVSTHASRIFLAVTHLTLAACSTVPTPMIDPAITCVVLTGIPKCAVPNNTSEIGRAHV